MPNASTSFFGWVAFLLQKYGMLFLRGTGMTLLIALTGTALGFALGLLVAIIRTIALPEKKKAGSNAGVIVKRGLLRFVHMLMNVYIQVFRGTPMIVQAVVIYYGAQYAGVFMDTTFAAVFIISINTGAYMAEIIRGGIVSVDKGQFEAAHAIGMTHWQTMTTVVLPQATQHPPVRRQRVDRQHQGFQRAERHLRFRTVLPGEERCGNVLPLLRGVFHHRGDLPHPDADRQPHSARGGKEDGRPGITTSSTVRRATAVRDIKISVENEKEAVKRWNA